MRMKNVTAMDKASIQMIYDVQVKASNRTFKFLIEMFEETGEDVMTKSEIVDRIKAYQEILNEEFKLENNE